jgi:hypothetical protein
MRSALEGHYRYEVRGIDLLGALSRPGARTVIRHHDDLAPPAPGARLLTGPSVEIPTDATSVDVTLAIDWDATHDFNGPDAADFRVAASWTPTEAIHVDVRSVSEVDLLHADVHLAALVSVANTLAGARLSMPGSEYQIVSHDSGASATMRVLKSAGRLPPAGAGLIYTAGRPTPKTRVASLPRRPAVAATVGSASGTPLELHLTPAGSIGLPAPGPVRIYLHLLTTTFDGEVIAGDRVRVTEPAAETAAAAAWARWQALGDPNAALSGSPALLFPEHEITMALTPPPGLEASLLTLYVTSADAASYVESPILPVADPALAAAHGNESAATERTLSVRSSGAPPRVSAVPFDPAVRTWARAAAQYAETALYDVTWDAVPGATRYQVWRAIEAGIAGSAGASDADLRDRASAQPDAFELRSDQVFGTSYTDAIPGRAPTRAIYQVRAVSVSGVPGEPSEPIGPVHVPDVRRPPAPNLVRAVATPPDEADRTIAIEWRQPGRLDDLRFEVLARPVAPLEPGFEVVGIIPRGEAPDASGLFRFLHGQRTPGKPYEYRVDAVREALDPIDPAAVLRRDIRGAESATATAVAISATPLAPPSDFVAAWDTASAALVLTWTVDESYESIEVQRRPPGRWVFQQIALLPPYDATYIDPSVGSGTWAYRLRALGVSREARSEVVEVTVS